MQTTSALYAKRWWIAGTVLIGTWIGTLSNSLVPVALPSMLKDLNVSLSLGVWIISIYVLTFAVLNPIFGWLGDRYSKRYLLMFSYILSAIGVLVLAYTSNMSQVYVFLVIYAIGYGGAIPIMMSIRGEYFGRKNFATIRGVMDIFQMVGTVVGPVFAGYVFDVSGSYYWAFMCFVVTYLAGAAVVLLAKRPTRAAMPAPAPAEVSASAERR